jgi:hypothetical protein
VTLTRLSPLRQSVFTASLALAMTCAGQNQPPATDGSAAAPPTSPAPAVIIKGGQITGSVKANNLPLPGVSITAANTLTGQKVLTSTDFNGIFSINVPSNGRWVIKAELAAFAPATQEAVINATNHSATVAVEMMLQSRARAQQQQQQEAVKQAMSATSTVQGRGFQNLGLSETGGGTGGDQNTVSANADLSTQGIQLGAAGDGGDNVSVSGAMGRTQTFGMDNEQLQERLEELKQRMARGEFGPMSNFGPGGGQMIMLGPGGPGGGGLGGGGGGFQIRMNSRFNINKPHGAIFYSLGDSALDAAPYSLSGAQGAKPSYAQNRYGFTVGGPFSIPKLMKPSLSTFFFVNYFGTRASNPLDVLSTVPTLAERGGDFSQALTRAGTPVQLFDPVTHAPIPGNMITSINPAAQGLLAFIPKPNLPGTFQNFRFTTSTGTQADNLNLRFVHNFAPRQQQQNQQQQGQRRGQGGGGRGGMFRQNTLSVGFNWRRFDSDIHNAFPTVGGATSGYGLNIPISYSRRFGKVNNSATVSFNRNVIHTTNLFAGITNVEGALGINGVSQNPFDWGAPNLSFTNFSGLNDVTPVQRRDNTWIFGDSANWTHGKHTLRFGADFRRIQQNPRTDSNARGSFIFTGFATANPAVPGSGFDLADFLLGLPQQASAQYGATGYYFRQNSWDLYVQDEWRMRGNLSINAGLRYEYVSPFSEKYGRIVNLDVNGNFTGATPVIAGQTGPFTGAFPASLVDPDRNNLAPRIGLAWKPMKNTVVRAGYGISYNTGAYATIVQQMAYQPPFAFTQTNIAASASSLALQNAFAGLPASTITNNFGAARNYRLPYVQNYNLDIQREIRKSWVLNLSYNASKGTDLDIVRAPNRDPSGLRIVGVQPFLWQSSQGSSILHAGSVRLRKRMQHGISFGGTYVFSKSIDDASSIGGGATVVAQNDLCLACERGLSSFDQRHRFTADYLIELPFGTNKKWLNKRSVSSQFFGDWQLSGATTIASGTPFTARVLGSFADVSRGTNGTLRADVTGQPIQLSDPTIAAWFNTAAFVIPPAGQFGDAGRNTVIGPGTVQFDMALSKTFSIKDMQSFEVRAAATNFLNTPNFTTIDTIVNSPTFGRVTGVSNMRRIQILLRYRF